MTNYDQFGEHSRTQFSSRSGGREVWPWIKRTTENSEFLMRKIFEVAIFDAKNQLDSKLIKSLRLRKFIRLVDRQIRKMQKRKYHE